MCLKLIKNLSSIDELPLNHDIIKNLAKKYKEPNLIMFRDKPNNILSDVKHLNLRAMQKE